MTFGEAIEALKIGKKVQRKGWNGKNMYLYLLPGCAVQHKKNMYLTQYEPVIVMYTAQKRHQPGWLASQADMLSEDWRIVP